MSRRQNHPSGGRGDVTQRSPQQGQERGRESFSDWDNPGGSPTGGSGGYRGAPYGQNDGQGHGSPGQQGGWRGDESRYDFGGGRSSQDYGWGDRDRQFQPEGGRYRPRGDDRSYPDYDPSRGEYGDRERMGSEAYGRPGAGGTGSRSQQGTMPKGYTRSDERIKDDVCEQLYRCGCDVSEISIDVKGGTVTLEGSITDRRMKHRIEDIVEECIGVKEVENRIRVARSSERQMGEGEAGDPGSSMPGSSESSKRLGSKSAQH